MYKTEREDKNKILLSKSLIIFLEKILSKMIPRENCRKRSKKMVEDKFFLRKEKSCDANDRTQNLHAHTRTYLRTHKGLHTSFFDDLGAASLKRKSRYHDAGAERCCA